MFSEETSPYSSDTIGGRLTSAREAQGLSTAQLARRLGVKSKTLSDWETDRSEPRANRLVMLAGMLGVSPAWILTGRGEGPSENLSFEEIRLAQAELRQALQAQASAREQIERALTRLAKASEIIEQMDAEASLEP